MAKLTVSRVIAPAAPTYGLSDLLRRWSIFRDEGWYVPDSGSGWFRFVLFARHAGGQLVASSEGRALPPKLFLSYALCKRGHRL